MNSPGHSAAGKSLLEKLWDEMDNVVCRLMSDGTPSNFDEYCEFDVDPKSANEKADEFRQWGEDRGQAQGLAWAIALIRNPYGITDGALKGIREEAMERWGEGSE